MDEFKLHTQLAKDTTFVTRLPLCDLLMSNDANYPWFILVPRIAEIEEIYQMDWDKQQQFLNESSLLSELLMQELGGDKLNVAALGNMVPQLHIHHVVRSKADASWPKPIWGQVEPISYQGNQQKEIIERIANKVNTILSDQ